MSKNTNLSFLTDYITADITNGRIGINTPSPTVAFDVTGVAKFSSSVSITGGTQPTGNGIHTYFSSNVSYIDSLQSGVAWRDLSIAGNDVFIKTGGIERFRINSTGAATFSNTVETTGAYFSNGNAYFGKASSIFTGGSANDGGLMVSGSNNLIFGNALTERMRITSAGNVGIGTSAPSSALDVNGIITGRNVIRYNPASTTSVSTTTTIISTASNTYGGLAMIWGNDASGNIFTDFIFYSLSAISVLSSQTISGGPSSRTYTTNGSGSLRLAMGSGTYTVRYQGLLV